eukprot:235405_1
MESEEATTSTNTPTIASDCDTNQHEATSSVSFGKFQCDVCPEYFPVSTMLLLHKRSHKKNLCKICGKYFKRLTRHRGVHTDVRPFQCDVCEKTFKIRGCLTKHKHTHNKKFKCNMCRKSFVSDVLLAEHIADQCIRPVYECSICDMSFKRKSNLSKHQRVHNHRPFRCKLCDKTFRSASELTKHEIVHSSARPFRCNLCQESFKIKSTLKNHMRVHSSARPFHCETCGKSFKSKASVRQHQSVHSNI